MKTTRRTFLGKIAGGSVGFTILNFLSACSSENRPNANATAPELERAENYPYDREPSSFLFVQGGKKFPYTRLDSDPMSPKSTLMTEDGRVPVPSFLKAHGLPSDPKTRRTAVIAYGSNAAAEQLARKFSADNHGYGQFHGNPVIPVVKAHILDFDVVYMGHIGFYGAVPATFAVSPNTETTIWLTYLTDDQLARMHQTENVGSDYDYGVLRNVSIALENGFSLREAHIYMDRWGALVWNHHLISIAAVEASHRKNPIMFETEILDLLRGYFNPGERLDDFILENIQNTKMRDERNSTLHTMTRRFEYKGFNLLTT